MLMGKGNGPKIFNTGFGINWSRFGTDWSGFGLGPDWSGWGWAPF